MKQIMEINVTIFQPRTVEGSTGKAVMIPFPPRLTGSCSAAAPGKKAWIHSAYIPTGA